MYNVDVAENTLPGTSIVQLMTSDADVTSHAVVEYYMTGDVNALDRFRVNPNTGTVGCPQEVNPIKNACFTSDFALKCEQVNPPPLFEK